MPTATTPELHQAITSLAGHPANVTKWVAAGILQPAGGRPGTGRAYPWGEVDLADATVARRLLDAGLSKAATAGALTHWRKLGRPDGYAGAVITTTNAYQPGAWTDLAAVGQALLHATSVVATRTW